MKVCAAKDCLNNVIVPNISIVAAFAKMKKDRSGGQWSLAGQTCSQSKIVNRPCGPYQLYEIVMRSAQAVQRGECTPITFHVFLPSMIVAIFQLADSVSLRRSYTEFLRYLVYIQFVAASKRRMYSDCPDGCTLFPGPKNNLCSASSKKLFTYVFTFSQKEYLNRL